ncbi:hypothetical protein KKH36_02865 [Patescibacteria group bacterium]|nr:hypothetical protein [Patescibacteria group bacterium]
MEKEISWKAFEYEFTPRSANWFWTVWILSFSIFFTAYLLANILFGILVLIIAFSISIFASRRPDLIIITLTPKKIIIGKKEIDLENFESFNLSKKNIILKSIKKFSPYTIIPLGAEVDREEIKEYLLEQLIQEDLQEPLGFNLF